MAESDGGAPATKADLQDLRSEVKVDIQDLRSEFKNDITELKANIHDLRTELKANIHDLRVEMKADLGALEERVMESMREVETNLLKAFYGWAQSTDKRLNLSEATDANYASRLGAVETRLLEVEKRLRIPPAA